MTNLSLLSRGVRSHVRWREERNILYKGVEISPCNTHFKNLERKPPNGKAQRGQYWLVVVLGRYKWY